MIRLKCLKQVLDPDFWEPENDGNVYVEVSLHEVKHKGNTTYRVAVWNSDDLGREIDVATYEEAAVIFHSILEEDLISDEFLEKKGFYGA